MTDLILKMKTSILTTTQRILSLLLLLSISNIAFCNTPIKEGYGHQPTPKWVIDQTVNFDKKLLINQPQQYLLVDTQINISEEKQHRYYRRLVKPISGTGLQELSEFTISFNPAFEELHLHNLILKRGNKSIDISNTTDVRFMEQETSLNQGIINGYKTVHFILKDIRVNDILEYSYSIVGSNPIFKTKRFGIEAIEWGVQIDKVSFRLLTNNKDIHLNINKKNNSEQITKARINGLYEFSYSKQDVMPVINEGDYPYGISPFAWIDFSEYNSWTDVNLWAKSLYTFNSVNDSITELFEKIDSQSSNNKQFIINALSFVQDEIRYLGLELGQNSHLPHSPEEVLDKRFGDCKDKTVLLNTLLGLKGIKAYPALVSTNFRKGINDRLASPGAFNHVISLVEDGDKKYWLDATRTYQAKSLDHISKIDYGFALVVGHKYQALQQMYPDQLPPYDISFSEEIVAESFDAPVSYTIKSVFHGISAEYQRYRFSNIPKEQIQKNFLDYYVKLYPGISTKKAIHFVDEPNKNQFTTYETYEISNYWKNDAGFITSPLNIVNFSSYLPKPSVTKREHPYYLGSPLKVSVNYKLQFPEDVGLLFNGEDNKFSHEAFQFSYRDTYNKKIFEHDASLEIIKSTIAPENMEEYVELRNQLSKIWYSTISFRNPGSLNGYSEVLKLRERLKELAEGAK